MRRFVIIGQTATASADFSLLDLPGTSGRLDVLLRCLRSALLVSHGLRRDTIAYLVLQGGPDAPRVLRVDGREIRFVRPDERALALLVQKALLARSTGAEPGAFHPLRPGLALASGGLEAVIADLGTSATSAYVLEEGARDLRSLPLAFEDAVVFVGDNHGFDGATRARLETFGATPIGVGPISIHADDAIAIVANEMDRLFGRAEPAPVIALLYVDEHVVVANKPSGLLVHRGWANDDDVALFRVRDAVGEHVHPIHRLDRGTSGALLFARSRSVAALLSKSFEERRVEKRYLALVRGTPPAEGLIDHPVPKSENGPRVPAKTRFRLVSRSPVDRCSLVVAMPETGRLHQIRRHLRHLSHPLLGDVTYGSGSINRHYRAHYDLHRLALHASRLSFEHPFSGVRVVVVAPVPDDLAVVLVKLGLPPGEDSAA